MGTEHRESAGERESRIASALYGLITAYRASQAISVVARLGIADLLDAEPRSSVELANAAGVHEPSLRRLLRSLATLGLFDEVRQGHFRLGRLGGPLRTGVPGSVRASALALCDDATWRAWGELHRSVRTGERALENGPFDALETDAALAGTFGDAMAEHTRQVAPAVVASYDFSRSRTVIDVGGGNGALLAAILGAHDGLHGVLFDSPTGLGGAQRELESAGVADRCRVVAGNFFESVPGGGDVYVLKSVIHDWDDASGRAILESCRRAMPESGRLLLVEPVLPDVAGRSLAAQAMFLLDLHMLVVAGGRERTEAEFRELLESAAFELTDVVATGALAGFCVLEGRPA